MRRIIQGDVLEVLADEPDDSYDGCFCDPPYGLSFMGKKWDHAVPGPDYWAEVVRVLKPGAMLLAFGGTRTWHRLACAIEDAGFELRDTLMWLHGQGFPKSHDISKAIDKRGGENAKFQEVRSWLRIKVKEKGLSYAEIDRALGNENSHKASHFLDNSQPQIPSKHDWLILRELLGIAADIEHPARFIEYEREIVGYRKVHRGVAFTSEGPDHLPITLPATPAAKVWDGYGTALKPAWEPVLLAMKPLDGTFAANACKWHVVGINVDGCRIGTEPPPSVPQPAGAIYNIGTSKGRSGTMSQSSKGRWPSNLLLSHLPGCKRRGTKRVEGSSQPATKRKHGQDGPAYGQDQRLPGTVMLGYADPDGLETVEAWECAEGCPVAALGLPARFFQTFGVDKDCFSMYDIEKQGGQPCQMQNGAPGDISERLMGDGIGNGESQEVESNIANSNPDGSGSETTAQSPRDTKSTTEIMMPRTMSPSTYNLSPQVGMTTITSDSEKITESLMGLSVGDVRDAENTNPSPSSISEQPEPTQDTAKAVPASICVNGELRTGSTTTPICENTRDGGAKSLSRWFYCSKSSRRERDAGLEGREQEYQYRANAFSSKISNAKLPRANPHPTCKPLALCQYLARLILPPAEYRDEAQLLVPFAGVMSEAIGAMLAGWRNVTAIELVGEYCEIGEARMVWWGAKIRETGLTEPRAILKAKGKPKPDLQGRLL